MSSPAGRADLHLHSAASDGVLDAAALVAEAARAGLGAIALTDHDSVAALPAAARAAAAAGIHFVPGVEISAGLDRASIHILGYCVDVERRGFRARLACLRDARLERARCMVQRLRELGVEVEVDRVLEIAGDAAVGRPHIAQAILEGGYVETFQEGFDRYIGMHAPGYVSRPLPTPREAIQLVLDAGGVPALAHPGTLRRDALIPQMASDGLVGLEVWHPRHGAERVRRYRHLARELGLIATGGSDYHGGGRGDSAIGEQPVPVAVVEALEARAG